MQREHFLEEGVAQTAQRESSAEDRTPGIASRAWCWSPSKLASTSKYLEAVDLTKKWTPMATTITERNSCRNQFRSHDTPTTTSIYVVDCVPTPILGFFHRSRNTSHPPIRVFSFFNILIFLFQSYIFFYLSHTHTLSISVICIKNFDMNI